MIDREHDLPIQRQAEVLGISRGTAYYKPHPVPKEDLLMMRKLDERKRPSNHTLSDGLIA